ncbi:MAG TPA: DUF1543 domain-containing protein [Puia sp.]|nr:DUF1543 domain-containing protein [Puia sp.]
MKLYMILLGSKPKGRNTEQHDVFFGIASSLEELYPELICFWPEAKGLHIDAWREVNFIDGYKIKVETREIKKNNSSSSESRLFFINLGGYQEFKFEEQHYAVLTVQPDKGSAIKKAKDTLFFQKNGLKKAPSHVDDKYGIDVDDIYQMEDILIPSHKAKYQIFLLPHNIQEEDPIHLGYTVIN